jgi:hypothetical protein
MNSLGLTPEWQTIMNDKTKLGVIICSFGTTADASLMPEHLIVIKIKIK